ncbi:Protein of unknown function [Streptomyces sp. LcepLS]|nr:polymerase [Streptomyces sp. CLI2509]EFK99332.1 conserved hypothetical protein [Streptomyces sp. SPB78]EGJ77989.1 hypothetical protein STTU_5200 [Streptomyces sp. Tu6071]MYQ61861.1 DUF4240 domain-containing protein [Streptomyces sp. SID4926]MYR30430.1 DUF4240 domain-containing protein [Streptomyces sp. SID4945]MYX21921.1 DUF4240 domain-containing protein [Streptomyces sp. SID8380]SCE38806.1 Protein of unknown function [Streptomyces sp. DfronAA-171]SCF49758.1 Protein of unknown function [S
MLVMDETQFWELIDSAREAADGDPEEQADVVVDRLLQLDPESVADFARHFTVRFRRAWTWELWGAAGVLLAAPEGADEESFDYFRCWLIAQGRSVFEGALADADSLAELLPDFDEEIDGDAGELGEAAEDAYEQLTGAPLPALGLPPEPEVPEGTPFPLDDEDELESRYPRLWERYGG